MSQAGRRGANWQRARQWARGPDLLVPLALGTYTLVTFAAVDLRWPYTMGEVWTANNAGLPFDEHVADVVADRHPPLFFLLTWLARRLSDADIMLRVPSLLFAVAAVVLLATWGRRLLGRPVAFVAAALVATHPYFLAEAMVARAVSATVLLGVAIPLAALQLARARDLRGPALLLSGLASVALYVHYACFLSVGVAGIGLWLAVGLSRRPARERMRVLAIGMASLAAAGLAFLPWLLGPIRGQDLVGPPVARNFAFLATYLWPVGEGHLATGTLLCWVLVLAGLVLARAEDDLRLLAGALPVAIAIPWLWSVNSQISFKIYLFAPLLPVWAMLVAIGATRTWGLLTRWLPTSAGGLGWLVLGALALAPIRSTPAMLEAASSPADVGCPGCWPYDPAADMEVLAAADLGQDQGHVDMMVKGPAEYFWSRTGSAPLMGQISAHQAWWSIERRGVAADAGPRPFDICIYDDVFAWRVRSSKRSICQRIEVALRRSWEASERGPYAMAVAQRLLAEGHQERALTLATEVIDARPHWVVGKAKLAEMLVSIGRAPEAAELLKAAVEDSPQWMPADPSTLRTLESLLAMVGDSDLSRFQRLARCAERAAVPAVCWTPLASVFGGSASAVAVPRPPAG